MCLRNVLCEYILTFPEDTMAPTRPSECPACGHEGIRRAGPALERISGGGVHTEAWNCRLCDYRWTRPLPPERPSTLLEGIDVHP